MTTDDEPLVQKTTIDGRPALALYLDAKHEPVASDSANAKMVRVIFTDERNGSMYLTINSDEQ